MKILKMVHKNTKKENKTRIKRPKLKKILYFSEPMSSNNKYNDEIWTQCQKNKMLPLREKKVGGILFLLYFLKVLKYA